MSGDLENNITITIPVLYFTLPDQTISIYTNYTTIDYSELLTWEFSLFFYVFKQILVYILGNF